MSRPSLAVVIVVLGNPGVRGDVRMAGFSADASLDEVCDVLSAGSESRRRTLRINALRALGKYVEKNFTDARTAAQWLTLLNQRLGVWAACACALEALKYVSRGDDRPRIVIETAEAWVRGEATSKQVRQAAFAARAAADAAADVDAYEAAAAADAAHYAAYVAVYANGVAAETAIAAVANAADAADSKASRTGDAAEIRRLVSVISERLVLFPEWTGKPSDDRWYLPTKRNR